MFFFFLQWLVLVKNKKSWKTIIENTNLHKWSCCAEKGVAATPCREYVACVECKRDVDVLGCTPIWIPENYDYDPHPERKY